MVKLELINWDLEFEKDILLGRGFVVNDKPFITVKGKEEKNMFGTHSPMFGTDWSDDNAFEERYSCRCGELRGRVFEGDECPKCETIVEYKDVNLDLYAWIDLNGYRIIQPGYFKLMKGIMSEVIIFDIINVSVDGNEENKNNPFVGIGLLEFYNRFEEIVLYFAKKKKRYKLASRLIKEKESIFTSHIPIYSSVLRPVSFVGEDYKYVREDKKINVIYNLSKLLKEERIFEPTNKKGKKAKKDLLSVLSEIQKKVMELWIIIFEYIDKKKGHIKKEILGGRVNFSARNVIVPDPTLKANEIRLCYSTFLELYKYELIPIISRINRISETEAYNIWYMATIRYSDVMFDIMVYYVNKYKPKVLINRNPTIAYGSVMMMNVISIKKEFIKDYTMAIPVFGLSSLNADFDGDILNIYALKTKEFVDEFKKFDPRRSMFISRNDGKFNGKFNLLKDQIIGLREFNNI